MALLRSIGARWFEYCSNLGLGLLRCLPPETSHRLTLTILHALYRLKLLPLCMHVLRLAHKKAEGKLLSGPVQVMGLQFPNRIGLAAGLDKNADYLQALSHLGLGFIEIGTVLLRPWSGNSRPRLWRMPKEQALINRLGLPSKGVEHVCKRLQACVSPSERDWILGINIGKHPLSSWADAEAEYCQMMSALWEYGDYFTINLSCPNLQDRFDPMAKSFLEPLLATLLRTKQELETRSGTPKALCLKLSPDMSHGQREELVQVLQQFPVDGVILTNTTMQHDMHRDGGLSGVPLALHARDSLSYFDSHLPDCIVRIACGGIHNSQEALQRRQAGADLVQVYTGLVYGGLAVMAQMLETLQE
ncbi:MAG: quinone-dependent dihydroorotate dehydrogenase [Gammaproteobacteria bacterium]